jgi:parvulin-like peptidyl-prolyl isomerase
MNIKHKFFTTALIALVLGMVSSRATSPAPALTGTNVSPTDAMTALFGDPVIAKGNGFTIKRSALDQIMTGAKAQAVASGQMVPAGFEAHALNQLITIQLLLQKATDADRADGYKEADTQFTNILNHYGSADAFARQLKAVGMTIDQLRTKARDEAVAKAALKNALNVLVTDAEVKAFYTDHPGDFEEAEKVHVRHILLMTIDPATKQPLPADQVAAKRKQIDDLLKRARGGEDFAALAKQYTEDTASKESGGEYTVARGQTVAEFEAAAFALTNGQISDVVTSQFGFHIIKLLDRIPAKKVGLADQVPGSDHAVAEDIKTYLMNQKIGKLAPDFVDKLKKSASVEIVDAGLKAEMDAADAEATNAAPATVPQ